VTPEQEDKGADRGIEATSDPIEKWIRYLSVGTALSASVCVVSIGVILIKRRRG